jgi:peptidoglycan hydrolase-like protein with peptidoglycan-binding domain
VADSLAVNRRHRILAALIALATALSTFAVGVPTATAARPRVLLIGDSTLAAVDWYPASKQGLSGLDYELRAASCRAVTGPSCVGRRDSNGNRIRPSNAISVLKAYPAGTFDELVLMVGYDEDYSTFKQSMIDMPQAARDLGIDHITWLTFRADVDYNAPGGVTTSYHGNNRLLVNAANSSGGFISLLDWNSHVRNNSGLVERDGVHLTAKGAASVTSLIRQAVINHWGSGATNNSPKPTTPSAPADGRPNLAYGSIGEPVKTAQKLLIAIGSPELAKYGVTGRYFAVTKTAVTAFQTMVRQQHDSTMVVDGAIGPATWKWLDKLAAGGAAPAPVPVPAPATPPSPNGTVGYGAMGPPVTEIQQILLRIGSPALEPYGATGRYFAATRDAVKYFQEAVKLKHDSAMVVDGVVGASTMKWLKQLDPG